MIFIAFTVKIYSVLGVNPANVAELLVVAEGVVTTPPTLYS